jgi:PAS domain S-box-containing protein
VADHVRDSQALEIRHLKEFFDLEIKSMENMEILKAKKAREYMEVQETHRKEVQEAKNQIQDTKYRLKVQELQIRHLQNVQSVVRHFKEEKEFMLAKQTKKKEDRVEKWRAFLFQETGLSGNFAEEKDKGLALASVFMDPQTSILRAGKAGSAGGKGLTSSDEESDDEPQIGASQSIVQIQVESQKEPGKESSKREAKLAEDSSTHQQETALRIAFEEKQRLESQLKRLSDDLKELRRRQREYSTSLQENHSDVICDYDKEISDNLDELRKLHDTQLLEIHEQQKEEIEQIKATQAKEAAMEENVRSSERQMLMERKTLNSVLETVVDGIITITPVGIISRFNASAESIFGYSAHEVIGRNIKMLQPNYVAEIHDDLLKNYLTTGERKVIGIGRQAHGRKKDGTLFPLHLSISEVKENGMHLFTGIVRDLTEDVAQQEAAKRDSDRKKVDLENLLQQLARERAKSSDLIHSMLPSSIVKRMFTGEQVPPQEFEDATVLFTEIYGFNEIVSSFDALDIVDLLDLLYCVFDEYVLNQQYAALRITWSRISWN